MTLIGILLLGALALAGPAFSQTQSDNNVASIELTPIILAIIDLLFPAVAAVATYLINAHIKDQRMATLLSNAVQNSVGIVREQAIGVVNRVSPKIPNVNPNVAAGVQYVLDNAAEAVAHFSIPVPRIAEKIEAKLGLAEIATNLAATASPAPVIAGPLSPIPTNP